LEVLAEIDADIVALQEADRRFGNRMSAIPSPSVARNRDRINRSRSVDARKASAGTEMPCWCGAESRFGTARSFRYRRSNRAARCSRNCCVNGHPLRVIGTHLDLSGLWRRRQIRALLARLDGASHHLPTVLMGDFNQWSDRGALSEFAFHHHRLVKTPPSFHSNRPVARLDRIIVSHDIVVRGQRRAYLRPVETRIGPPALMGDTQTCLNFVQRSFC
jgi:endonuclease/exonuclease/phosphatase family metal-dependent hydrolase